MHENGFFARFQVYPPICFLKHGLDPLGVCSRTEATAGQTVLETRGRRCEEREKILSAVYIFFICGLSLWYTYKS